MDVGSFSQAVAAVNRSARPLRDYKAAHALRGTPPRRHDNMRSMKDATGDVVGMTRGERRFVHRHASATRRFMALELA